MLPQSVTFQQIIIVNESMSDHKAWQPSPRLCYFLLLNSDGHQLAWDPNASVGQLVDKLICVTDRPKTCPKIYSTMQIRKRKAIPRWARERVQLEGPSHKRP